MDNRKKQLISRWAAKKLAWFWLRADRRLLQTGKIKLRSSLFLLSTRQEWVSAWKSGGGGAPPRFRCLWWGYLPTDQAGNLPEVAYSLILSFISGGVLRTKMSKEKQHGRIASVSSNVRVLMTSVVSWMPRQPWNQLRHSLLIYSVSVASRFRVVLTF